MTKLIQIHLGAQGTPRPATTCLGAVDLCGEAESQGAIRVRPVKFIKLKQIKSWPCGGRLCIGTVALVQGVFTSEPHDSVSPFASLITPVSSRTCSRAFQERLQWAQAAHS